MTVHDFTDYMILDPEMAYFNFYKSRETLVDVIQKITDKDDSKRILDSLKAISYSAIGCVALLLMTDAISGAEAKRITHAIDVRTNLKHGNELVELWELLDDVFYLLKPDKTDVKKRLSKIFKKLFGFRHRRFIKKTFKEMDDDKMDAFCRKLARNSIETIILKGFCKENDGPFVLNPKHRKDVLELVPKESDFTNKLICMAGVPDLEYSLIKVNRHSKMERIEEMEKLGMPESIIMTDKKKLLDFHMMCLATSPEAVGTMEPMDRIKKYLEFKDILQKAFEHCNIQNIDKPNFTPGSKPDYNTVINYLRDFEGKIGSNDNEDRVLDSFVTD